jgi:sugar lactone lactonase YvrE
MLVWSYPDDDGIAGVLFRLDLDGSFHRVIENVAIPNGLTWSRDDKTMYFTASEEQTIFAYDFDAETGAISNKRPFFKPETATPDGHAQDVDGNLWVALWGGSKVVRVSPEGKVTAEIAVPTRCPTASVLSSFEISIC